MNLNITESYGLYSYGAYNRNGKTSKNRGEDPSDFEHMRKAVSRTAFSNRGEGTADINVKPDYMPYAGNHVVNNKNEYFAMAKDDMIIYQGIVFTCDRLTDTLTLGDVSDPDRCVRVGLTKGGSLLFNRDNAGSLMNALTMFSPDDQERIVKAIQIDNMAQKARKEVEDSKSGENVKSSDEDDNDTSRNDSNSYDTV